MRPLDGIKVIEMAGLAPSPYCGMILADIGTNVLDGGAPYYQTYETADHKYMAVGAIEGRFYEEFVRGLQLDPASLPDQNEKEHWPKLRARFAEIFRNRHLDVFTNQYLEILPG